MCKYLRSLKNSLVLNEGNDKFSIQPLPLYAQFSAVNAVANDNFIYDSEAEVLIAGNFYPFNVEMGRQDAGIGLLLEADEENNLVPVPFRESGLKLEGDVRDMTVVETALGEKLLIVTRNDGPVQVLKFAPANISAGLNTRGN